MKPQDTVLSPMMEAVIHELRNALTVLSCTQQLLAANREVGVERFGQQLDRLTQIVAQMDQLVHRPKPKPQSFSLLDLAKDCLKDEKVKVEWQGERLPGVRGGQEELRQALAFIARFLSGSVKEGAVFGRVGTDNAGARLILGASPDGLSSQKRVPLKSLAHPTDPCSPLSLQVAGYLLNRWGLKLSAFGDDKEGKNFLIQIPVIPNDEAE